MHRDELAQAADVREKVISWAHVLTSQASPGCRRVCACVVPTKDSNASQHTLPCPRLGPQIVWSRGRARAHGQLARVGLAIMWREQVMTTHSLSWHGGPARAGAAAAGRRAAVDQDQRPWRRRPAAAPERARQPGRRPACTHGGWRGAAACVLDTHIQRCCAYMADKHAGLLAAGPLCAVLCRVARACRLSSAWPSA